MHLDGVKSWKIFLKCTWLREASVELSTLVDLILNLRYAALHSLILQFRGICTYSFPLKLFIINYRQKLVWIAYNLMQFFNDVKLSETLLRNIPAFSNSVFLCEIVCNFKGLHCRLDPKLNILRDNRYVFPEWEFNFMYQVKKTRVPHFFFCWFNVFKLYCNRIHVVAAT